MRSKTTGLGWGLLPVAVLLCHCSVKFESPPPIPPIESDAGSGEDTAAPAPDAGPVEASTDGAAPTFGFQPSNVPLAAIDAAAAQAMDEDVASPCTIQTDTSAPEQDCFNTNPIAEVTQSDGSTVNLIVVNSLKLETNGVIRVTGTVPLVLVSLSDVTLSGTIDAHSEDLSPGAGGATEAQSDAAGLGKGGGVPGSDAAGIGGGGGSYCGAGGLGGGQSAPGMVYGSSDIRPLAGGSSGGGGAVGSGAGGGAVQIVAAGTLTMMSGSTITVGGEGGPFGGVASDQNAGGGGSGGAILLEATNVSIGGVLAANGGGGGGDYSNPGGADATPDANAAPGGAAGASGAAGGNGAAAGLIAGSNGNTKPGLNAGGGGGGAGWIRINTAATVTFSGTTSPSLLPPTSCSTVSKVRMMGAGP
jgi:hypothetical protein